MDAVRDRAKMYDRDGAEIEDGVCPAGGRVHFRDARQAALLSDAEVEEALATDPDDIELDDRETLALSRVVAAEARQQYLDRISRVRDIPTPTSDKNGFYDSAAAAQRCVDARAKYVEELSNKWKKTPTALPPDPRLPRSKPAASAPGVRRDDPPARRHRAAGSSSHVGKLAGDGSNSLDPAASRETDMAALRDRAMQARAEYLDRLSSRWMDHRCPAECF
jgi:hypothetical protein